MRCAACAAELRATAKFCDECGAPIASPTGGVREPRVYTPRHLTEKILGSRAALEGERKQVTVLFADVKGSMDLAEQVDPEDWHRIMDRFFQLLAEGVHRFEGTVTQFTGDGVMALFGAPIAHEDHAQRACYAALHLQEALRRYAHELRLSRGLNFAVRMGLNSGEVVVGTIGDDLRMDYTAQGHVVGLAARMEQIAEPGKVYVAEYTTRLVTGFFRLADLGPLTVKGVRDPLRVYELEGTGSLRTKLDVSRSRGFTRFVGRADEMATLDAALARALEGYGQVVGIVAEPGVGKSRLCYEFAERCRARGLSVYDAHCVAYGKMIPFLPILEIMRGYFGITEQDGDRVAREKIAGRLLLLDRELAEALPLFFDFLGVADPAEPPPRMDPEARQHQLFAAIRRLVQASSQRDPGIVLAEDLHWADGGSDAFFANHVDAVPGTRALLLVNFRPEYHASWMQKSYYQQLPLVPLGADAIAEMLRDLLGADPSLAGLADRIRARTGGNPFFIEEVVQGLVEAGNLAGTKGAYRLIGPPGEAAIPATVQAVLAARIDRLAEREKQVLQTAAVIGKEFAEPVLRRVAGLADPDLTAALRALVAAEFVYEEALYPEAEYAFKHPLTQEVAYRSQLAERRGGAHAATARAIEELYRHRADERAALLAYHWESAGDLLAAARWRGRAAAWILLNNPGEALSHFRKVRAQLAQLPESAEAQQIGLAAGGGFLLCSAIQGVSPDELAAVFAEAKASATALGDLRGLTRLLDAYVFARGSAGAVREALEHAGELARFLEQRELRYTPLNLAWLLFVAGRLGEALRVAGRSVELTREEPAAGFAQAGFTPHAWFLGVRGWTLSEMGRPHEAARDLDLAAELAREHGELVALGWIEGVKVAVAWLTGEVEGALAHARQGVDLAEKSGGAYFRVFAYGWLGLAHLLREEWVEAERALEEGLATARERGAGLCYEGRMLAHLAESYLGQGDLRRASSTAEEAVAVARERETWVAECVAHLTGARVLGAAHGVTSCDAGRGLLERALELAEQSGARSYVPFILVERAALARLTGDEATRQRELREAHRLFTEMGATARAEQVARELGSSAESTSRISSTGRT